MNLSHEPFAVFYALLPFILRKDLGASLLELSIFAALRPVLPLFSFYWGANLSKNRHRLKQNLMLAWIFARLPFLFVYWIDHVWYLIFCAGCYELFNRSGIPALIEILKINLTKEVRDRLYTVGFILNFIESIALGLCLANTINYGLISWKNYCFFAVCLGLSSIIAQWKFLLPKIEAAQKSPPLPIRKKILAPWKTSYQLLSTNPPFARFQWRFMLGGFALMLAAPGLSLFYADTLELTHGEVMFGRSVLMGLGIILSAHLWKRSLEIERVDLMTSRILFGFLAYFLFLWCARFHIHFFYLAYFTYGLTQAGSHLLWNLSGPLFAKEQDSTPFSNTNLLMVGLRGLIAPFLGALICSYTGPSFLFLLGALLCTLPLFLFPKKELTELSIK